MATLPINPIATGIAQMPAGGAKLWLQKNSPTMMIVGGCVGIGVGVVMACKATLKADAILNEIEAELDKVNHVKAITDEDTYSEKDYQRDLTTVYAKGGAKFVKLYLPAAIVIIGSMALILGGHKIILNRHLALAAAYETMSIGYNNYRNRVREELGEDKDRDFAYGLREEVVGEIEEVDKNGKKKKKKLTAKVPSSLASAYAFYWDDSCNGWEPNPYYNETYLIGKQREWNRKLSQRWQLNGFVTLAEIKQDLGVLVRPQDKDVGWICNPNYDPEQHGGKDQIDFGIFSPRNADAINGSEPVYILEPNVQGYIYGNKAVS